MEKNAVSLCSFLSTCVSGTNACEKNAAANCGEFQRRHLLEQTLCPVMQAFGYKNDYAKCDNLALRAQVPVGSPCHINGKCIREILYENFFATYKKLYWQKNFIGLREPIKILLNRFYPADA